VQVEPGQIIGERYALERPIGRETTAFGAAALAGLAVGFWSDPAEIAAIRAVDRRFLPAAGERREAGYRAWRRAVERVRGWAAPD